jgi:hypothetical protein
MDSMGISSQTTMEILMMTAFLPYKLVMKMEMGISSEMRMTGKSAMLRA